MPEAHQANNETACNSRIGSVGNSFAAGNCRAIQAWMATFSTRRSADYRDAPSVMNIFPARPATAHASAPSPAAKIRPATRITDYPRLSRLKPNADGMQAIT